MPSFLKVFFALMVASVMVGQAQAQGRLVVFEGAVLESQGATSRLIVVFQNGREVGRAVAPCDSGRCMFEIVVADESGVGDVGPDGLGHVIVNNLEVGAPQVIPGKAGSETIYAVMVIPETPDNLPPSALSGRLGLFPDGGVAVIEPTRPPDIPRPGAPAPQASTPNPFPWLAVALLGLTCCGSLGLLALMAVGAYFVLRRSPQRPESGLQ